MMSSKSLESFRKNLRDEEFIQSIQALMENEVKHDVLTELPSPLQVKLVDVALLDETKKRVLPGTFHAEYVLSELLPILKGELRESVRRVVEQDMNLSKDLELLNALNERIEGIEGVIRKKVGALRLAIDKEVEGITNRVLGELSGFSKEFQGEGEEEFSFPSLDPKVIATAISKTRSLLSVSMRELDEMLTTFLQESLDMFIGEWDKFSKEINKSLEEDFLSIDKLLKETRNEVYQQIQKIGRASVADDAIFQYDLENILGKLQGLISGLKESQTGEFREAGEQIVKEVEKANQLFFLALRSNLDGLEQQLKAVFTHELDEIEQVMTGLSGLALTSTTEFTAHISERVKALTEQIQGMQSQVEETLDNLNSTLTQGIQQISSKLRGLIDDLLVFQQRVADESETRAKTFETSKNVIALRFSTFENSLRDMWNQEEERLKTQSQALQDRIITHEENVKKSMDAMANQEKLLEEHSNKEGETIQELQRKLEELSMRMREQEGLLGELENVINNPVSGDLKTLQKRMNDVLKTEKKFMEESMKILETQKEQAQKRANIVTSIQEQARNIQGVVVSFTNELREQIKEAYQVSALFEDLEKKYKEDEEEITRVFEDALGENSHYKLFLDEATEKTRSFVEVNQSVFEELETHKAVNTSFIRHNLKSYFDNFYANLEKELTTCQNDLLREKESLQDGLKAKQNEVLEKQKEARFEASSKLKEITTNVRNKVIRSMEKTMQKVEASSSEIQDNVQVKYESMLKPIEENIEEIQSSMKDVFTHFSKSRQEFLEQALATLDAALLKSANLNKNRGKESIQRLSEKYSNKIQALNTTKMEFLESTHKSLSQVTEALLSQLNQLEQEIGEQVVTLVESIESFQKMKPTLVLNLLHEVHSKIDDITHNLLVRLLKWVNVFENDTINDLALNQLSNYIYKIKKDVFEGYSIPEKNVELAVRETLVTINELVTELGLLNARLKEKLEE